MSELIHQIESLGRYKVLRHLGEGGMAHVFLAYDSRLQTHVALKVLKENKKRHFPDLEAKFIKEARVLMGITHPHVVRVFDLHHQAGLTFLVLEFVDGSNLKKYLLSHPFLSFSERLDLFKKICLGVKAIHEKNLIHRDLKPENILVSTQGELKIADFGIANDLGNANEDGLGTPAYMAPEQSQDQVSSNRSDIYTLGVIGLEVLFSEKKGSTVPVQDVRSRAIRKILGACLVINPGARISDMDSLMRQLEVASRKDSFQKVSHFFENQVSLRSAWVLFGVGLSFLISGVLFSKPKEQKVELNSFYELLSECAPQCEEHFSKITALLSQRFSGLQCGDGRCTTLEGLCGLCAQDCVNSELGSRPALKPLCQTFHLKAPKEPARFEARKAFDQCLFSLNPDGFERRRSYVFSVLSCAQDSSSEWIHQCSRNTIGSQTPNASSIRGFMECVFSSEAKPSIR